MPKRPSPGQLTDKEAAFVAQYLIDKDKGKAALRAGYAAKSAKRMGSYTYARPHVKAAIEKALKAQARRTLVTADANLLSIEELAVDARAAGEFASAIRARELIGKHYRSFTDKVELTGKNDGPVEFTEIRRTIVRPDKPKP